jgi:hypothetical protein
MTPIRLCKTNYGPIFLKILTEFSEHHKIKCDELLPINGEHPSIALSKILTLMSLTMGDEKHSLNVKEVDDYCRRICI